MKDYLESVPSSIDDIHLKVIKESDPFPENLDIKIPPKPEKQPDKDIDIELPPKIKPPLTRHKTLPRVKI